MDKEKIFLHDMFGFKALLDVSIDKTREVIYIYCQSELSLKHHMMAQHTADAERPPPPHQRQTAPICCFLSGLSLPRYAVSILFEHAVPLKLF